MSKVKLLVVSTLILVMMITTGFSAAVNSPQSPTDTPTDQAALGDTYIVVFKPNVDVTVAVPALAQAHGLQVRQQYRFALRGMAAVVPPGRVNALRNDPRVAYVEADQMAYAFELPTGIDRIDVEPGATLKPEFAGNYSGIGVAVIDSGVASHPDLNIVFHTDCTSGTCIDGNPIDQNGHGTHVAGTVAANGGVIGVAPGAAIYGVRVLDRRGSGQISWIVAGIDRVTQLRQEGRVHVANMSLGCECSSQAMDDAITASINAGVTYVVAAGNSAKDASTFSPANHPSVITVSALADFDGKPGGLGAPTCRTDVDDTLADFSNYGGHVEVAAPGVCILSTWNNGGYNTISGTSMASPHVAGAAVRAVASGASNPAQVKTWLVSTGETDWTDEVDGYTEPRIDLGTGGSTPTNQAPSASFAYSTSDLTAYFTDTSSDSDGFVAGWSWNFGDGNTSTAQNPSHTYATGGTYLVALTVTDDDGATSIASQYVSVSSTPTNQAPSASFTYSTSDLTASFTDTSSDSDGFVAGWSWDFGDGNTSTAQNPSHTYAADGTYLVVLTATDDDGATSSTSQYVTVSAPTSNLSVHVGDLDGVASSKGNSRNWEAFVTVTVHNSNEQPVGGATVTGTFSGAVNGTVSGTTASDGTVTFTTGNMGGSNAVTFTVNNVSSSSGAYDPAANHDPDGDSNGTSIDIFR